MNLRATFLLTAAAVCACTEPAALQTVVDDAWIGAQGYHFSGRLTEVRPSPEQDDGRLRALYRNTRHLLTSGEEGNVVTAVKAVAKSLGYTPPSVIAATSNR